LLHLILVGQPELRATLEQPELRQLAQRVSVFYHLGPLSLEEAQAYVQHRVTAVGGPEDLFSDGAVQDIWRAAKGIPRVMNTLCDLSLVYGFSASAERIDEDIVDEVLADRNRMGIRVAAEPVLTGGDQVDKDSGHGGATEFARRRFGD
jgi:type II secretory pathway predicted ATPase ExeA